MKHQKPPPSNALDAVLGRNVRALMDSHSVVQEGLSEIIHVSSTGTVSELLRGKRRWNTDYILAVVAHFKCSVASLFVGATEMDRQVSFSHHQMELLSAYYAASDRDKGMVDFILFGGKKDNPLGTAPPPLHPSPIKA